MRSLVTVTAALSLGGMAHADGVGVVVAGEPTKLSAVSGNARAWLEQNGHTFVARPLDGASQKTFLNCFVVEDIGCARATFEKRSAAPSLVYVHVDLVTAHELALTGYWLVKDHEVVAEKRWCKHCDDAELQRTVGDLMKVLVKVDDASKGHVEIHSKPEGAEVAIDHVRAGATPLERDLPAGPHEIALQRGGETVASKTVKVEPGATASVTLVAGAAEPVGAAPAEHPSRALPIALVGAGVAGVAVGGVFLYYGHKGGPDTPLVYPYDTAEGIAFGVAGVAAIAVGVVLWRRGEHASGAPTAAIGHGGAAIGWVERF